MMNEVEENTRYHDLALRIEERRREVYGKEGEGERCPGIVGVVGLALLTFIIGLFIIGFAIFGKRRTHGIYILPRSSITENTPKLTGETPLQIEDKIK
jgi:hypothetical protein